MAYIPAHCDNNCLGCEKNKSGWCIWKDRATIYYRPEAFKAEIYRPKIEFDSAVKQLIATAKIE